MCGITGVVSRAGRVEPIWALRMTEAVRHRGPDDEGYLAVTVDQRPPIELAGDDTRVSLPHLESLEADPRMVLGHRRLAILDLSVAGHQPMSGRRRAVWLVYNGEIYNHAELRSELQRAGHEFRSTTDTEVLLAAYLEWGEACLDRLDGMWAFVIYDHERGVLFGARDRFGVKPLYYFHDDEHFAFVSEIKGLLELPFIERRVDPSGVFDFLVLGGIDWLDKTLFRGVLELPPAHAFRIDLRAWRLDRWSHYRLEFCDRWQRYDAATAERHAERVRELLKRSVRLRMRADVPLGSCLSGGLDSSSIVCLSAQLLQAGESHGSSEEHNVFSACFREPEADESRWAELVARHASANWYRVSPTANEFAAEIDDLARCQELPFVSPSLYAQHRVMRLARERGTTVLLDGQGGDELFTGYTMYYEVFLHELLRHFDLAGFSGEWRGMSNAPIGRRQATAGLVKQLRRSLLPYAVVRWYRQRRSGRFEIFDRDFWQNHRDRWGLVRLRDFRSLNSMLHSVFTRQKLSHLLRYEDRNSMWFSIEARTPFVDDRELVESVFAMASAYKIHDGWSKYLLREAMRGIVPEEVIERRDKMGFVTPERRWLDALWPDLRPQIARQLEGFLDAEEIAGDLWRRVSPHGASGVELMWRIISFAVWRRVFQV